MLYVNKVSKRYGAQPILEEISFVVNPGERIGLIGPNGGGKTTLLRIVAGLEQPDAGSVSVASTATLGYLPQGLELTTDRTVGEEVRAGIPGWETSRREVEQLAARMGQAQGVELEKAVTAYGEALTCFEALGGYEVEHRTTEVLAGLGLTEVFPDTPLSRLSGGQRTRVGLARILLAQPSLLLLDEPTNHLDIGALEWLEGFLDSYRGAALIVSHDRTFLDRTVRRVLELDEKTHRLTEYTGNYSDYEAAKDRERGKQWAEWKDQQAEIRRMEADIRRTKEQALHVEESTINDQTRRYAKKVARKAKSRERRLERYLSSDDRVDKPPQTWQMKLEFGEMPRGGQVVLTLSDLGHRFGERWLFRHASQTLQHGERIALFGANGSGKTTLLRVITGALAPVEGSARLGANVRLGYMPQEQETLDPAATPLAVVRRAAPLSETEARNFLHYFLFGGDDVFVPVGRLSYGERARLLLARLVLTGTNFLILDEPINHLDIPSRERFLAALEAFPGTVLAAVHDRAFIDEFASGVWALDGGTVRRYSDREEATRKGR
jgi:ATP-binding cassette subfamily F protein 3